MKELDGIWWTINQNKIAGKLTITNENKICLTTYAKIYDTNIICGFAEGKQVTLVDVTLDRTNIYKDTIKREEIELNGNKEELDLEYKIYVYLADIAIFGHVYERKGDIRFQEIALQYTNLEQWLDWEIPLPRIEKEKITMFEENTRKIKTEKFDMEIRNPYIILKNKYNIKIENKVEILISNIRNKYLSTMQGIIQCIQFFLILCMGDNINIKTVQAKDTFDRKVEIIMGYGISNYENRSIIKNIIKYKDIENNFETILKKWMRLYEENELLMTNFTQLQTHENHLINEYMSIMSAIDSTYLLITKQEHTNEPIAEIMKKILTDTKITFDFNEKEIEDISIKAKEIRRYFVHSNKKQKNMVHSNISIIKDIIIIFIEAIRVEIMLEIGINKDIIKKYYERLNQLRDIKYNIVNDINEEKEIINEREKEGGKTMNSLSKKDSEFIAQLNAIMGTRYRETQYDLENQKDLIEAVTYVTAEYMDYMHYWSEINNVIENFDQSLEVFHPEKWFKGTIEKNTGDELIERTTRSLSNAEKNMYELALKTEDKCRAIWKYLLSEENKEAQIYFLGDISKYKKQELEEALETVLENIYEIEYKNQVEEDSKHFAKELLNILEMNTK